MTDTATQFRASNEAQEIVFGMIEEADALIKHVNDLFNSPSDEEAFILTFRACARITASLGELNRLVKHEGVGHAGGPCEYEGRGVTELNPLLYPVNGVVLIVDPYKKTARFEMHTDEGVRPLTQAELDRAIYDLQKQVKR